VLPSLSNIVTALANGATSASGTVLANGAVGGPGGGALTGAPSREGRTQLDNC
jgi:hypothetical protein